MKTVKIYNASDEFEAQMLISILEENHIPCYAMDSDIGEYMKITQGFSVFGIDLYVDTEDERKAKELVEQACKDVVISQDDEIEENVDVSWYRNRVILARLLLVGGIGIMIFLWMFGNLC